MKQWLRSIRYGLRRAMTGSASRPMVSVLATGAIGVSLLLFGLVHLVSQNVGHLTSSWGGGVQMVVYLSDDMSPSRARRVAGILKNTKGVRAVDYVAPDEAFRRLQLSLGDRGEILDGVEDGYLPASLELTLDPGVRDVASVSPLVDRLRKVPGVEEVEFMGDWVDRVTALLASLRMAALALALIAGAACVYVVASTIKLGIYARKEEIEILKLVGATERFVKTPLLVEGAMQGTLGATTAVGLLYGLFRLGGPVLQRLLEDAVGDAPLVFLPGAHVAAIILAGALLGLLGSWIGVGRYAEL